MKLSLLKLLSVLTTVLSVPAFTCRAATLTMVPMQGTMVHVGLEYFEAPTPHLETHITNTSPVLIPLSVSDPTSHFEPGAAWYRDLDPDARALAFSRRYGFVRGGDLLPEGQTIWIRQLSATPGLEAYTYRMNQAAFAPMFGTAGSSDVLEWDERMFHPCYAAPPELRDCTATYEAFVVDALGQPVGLSTQFTLSWPISPPLQLATVSPSNGQSVVTFVPPASWTNSWIYAVERSTNMTDWTWVGALTNPPAGPQSIADDSAPPAGACYRLRALLP
jgi:hypothetical protein